jgi:FkbM family methyltransferase
VGHLQPDLIYDVGLHDGRDTDYYLSKGYRVVAIEANPELAERARERFAAEIDAGRLMLLNIAIGEVAGQSTFWVSDDHTDWSSFDRSIAGRDGARHHSIEVALRPFGQVLKEHGLPRYCKIDIEGSEPACLAALSHDYRPSFISVELTDHPSLERLADMGYDRFKVIDQYRFSTANSTFYRLKSATSRPRARALLERLNTEMLARRRDGDWRFGIGSSGPLPERTRGRWLSYREARRLTEFLVSRQRSGVLALYEWFDLHASDRAVVAGDRRHLSLAHRFRTDRRPPTHRPSARANRK